jgi:MraZ protein
MLEFTGQYNITFDKSGRFKLPPRILSDYLTNGETEVVIYCLPEGCLGIYPLKTWQAMRADERVLDGSSMLKRREMRRFGALSTSVAITKQGRLTIPQNFRELCKLGDPQQLLIGSEVGMEIWNATEWEKELALVNQYNLDKGLEELDNKE